jgi:hypothetical protein
VSDDVAKVPELAESIAAAFHGLEIIHRQVADYGVALIMREEALRWGRLARIAAGLRV